MKIKSAFIIASVILGLRQLTHAQCPELCDSNQNTAVGESALLNTTTGTGNTAVGFEALMSNISGSFNTAYGLQALSSSLYLGNNTAIGAFALTVSTTGVNNTAIGYQSLSSNTTGLDNTAVGYNALTSVTIGARNTAVGGSALSTNIGWYNSALGNFALMANTGGYSNSAVGDSALSSNTTGDNNTALGVNTLIQNTTGRNNLALGFHAGVNITTGDNNIDIGSRGVPGDSNTIRIGRNTVNAATYIAGISGVTVPGGVGVLIDSDGHLGTNTSSARFKENIQPMANSSEALLSLQPVTFRYKKQLDRDDLPQFGLVAEQVEKVNPDLVVRDEQGKPYTVRYEAVNAMLLNEFLKEHKTVEEQGATIARQQKQIDALTAGFQKVSAQLEVSKAAPETVSNDD